MLSNIHNVAHVTHFDTNDKQSVSIIETDTSHLAMHNYRMRNKWLADRIEELDKTQSALAELLGLGRARITDIIKGRRSIGAEEVTPIASFLEWPVSTVLRMIGNSAGQKGDPKIIDDVVPIEMVTVVGVVQGGEWKQSIELSPSERFDVSMMDNPRFRRIPKFGLLVRGPSVNQVFPEGSVAVCVSLIHLGEGFMPENESFVVVEQYNEANGIEATIKQIIFEKDDSVWLWPRSNHPGFQTPMRLPTGVDEIDQTDRIRVSALVIGGYRNFI